MELVRRMLDGDSQALARLITLVEEERAEVPDILEAVRPRMGQAYCVGVTGVPGGGKSTLVDRLTALYRAQGLRVGVLAVDPTSPFTGGAVLGDRIRMQQHYLDPGVFIRSMATRGSHGGLPRVAKQVVRLLDAYGLNVILVETVGVGQTELDIVEVADTVVVVLIPGLGDGVQTLKAGVLEISDILVVNKADRQGANGLVANLKGMLALGGAGRGWKVPILATQANVGLGVEELEASIEEHHRMLEGSSGLIQRRRERRLKEYYHSLEEWLGRRLMELAQEDAVLKDMAFKVEKGELDPSAAAARVLKESAWLRRFPTSGEG